jgi:hypothetical protein
MKSAKVFAGDNSLCSSTPVVLLRWQHTLSAWINLRLDTLAVQQSRPERTDAAWAVLCADAIPAEVLSAIVATTHLSASKRQELLIVWLSAYRELSNELYSLSRTQMQASASRWRQRQLKAYAARVDADIMRHLTPPITALGDIS